MLLGGAKKRRVRGKKPSALKSELSKITKQAMECRRKCTVIANEARKEAKLLNKESKKKTGLSKLHAERAARSKAAKAAYKQLYV